MSMTTTVPMVTHALGYAENEWSVFPLAGKVPYAGSHGHLDATTDPAQISQWWTERPNSNIGLATGQVSGVLVIDQDGPAGERSLRELEETYGPLPDTRTARSGRDETSRHFYFEMPSDGTIRSRGGIAPGIDCKANGGYTVLPPSIHPQSKRAYDWLSDEDEPIASLSDPWLRLLTDAKPTSGYIATNTLAPARIIAGEKGGSGRNDALTREAGRLRRIGWEADEMFGALAAFNKSRCEPPLGDAEVRKIANSVARYEPGEIPKAGSNVAKPLEFRAGKVVMAG